MKNSKKTAIPMLLAVVPLVVAAISGIFGTAATISTIIIQPAQAFIDQNTTPVAEPKAPMAVSQDGNNVYVVWWTNKSENWEVMFRASNDGGHTFGPLIMLGTNGTISTTASGDGTTTITANTTGTTTTGAGEEGEG